MGDTDLAGDDGVEEALPSEVTLARPVRGLNVELENTERFKIYHETHCCTSIKNRYVVLNENI